MRVDACCHPVVAAPGDLNAYMPRPYRGTRYPPPLAGVWPNPINDYVPGSSPSDGSLPGSDPDLMFRDVLDGPRMDVAVLLALTRGRLGDPQAGAVVDTATNEWLAATWLDTFNSHGRYRGSIRVSPRAPDAAVKEIERWADHPSFVQVAVPLEAHLAYGDPSYHSVWEAAASRGLPVVVHSDRGGGAQNQPVPLGYPSTYLEAYSHHPIPATVHIGSLIAHGVFEMFDGLVFVFADGAFDFLQTMLWRLDKDWRSGRAEVPWVRRAPSEYVTDHIRFVVHASDGEPDDDGYVEFIELTGLQPALLYGSNYPHWEHLEAGELEARLPDGMREAIMGDNAALLYGLPAVEARRA